MSENDSIKEIEKPLKRAGWIIVVGFIFTLLGPWLLTLPSSFSATDFSSTGDIGDTIGGITAPIIGLLGAVLLFLALQAQVKANSLIQRQFYDQAETNQLYQLYNHLKENIDNFTFEDKKGALGIYSFFEEIYCNEHDSTEKLETDPNLAELRSTLTIFKVLFDRIDGSNSPEKETIKTLTVHQFRYRIMPKLNGEGMDKLKRHPCESCKFDHGLPDEFCELIDEIKSKLY